MKKLLALIMILNIHSAFPGQGGNGGFSVSINNRSYAFDLYESGLQESYEDINHVDLLEVDEILASSIPSIDEKVIKYFSFKLNTLSKHSRSLAMRLIDLLRIYDWKMTPGNLIPTVDVGSTPIEIGNLTFKKVIFRDDRDSSKIVWINANLFQELDPRNQSALIFHELLYAVAVKFRGDMTSENTRKAVSLLYSPSLNKRKSNEVMQKFTDYLGFYSLGLNSKGISCDEVLTQSLDLSSKVEEVLETIKIKKTECEKFANESYCYKYFPDYGFGLSKKRSVKFLLEKGVKFTTTNSSDGRRVLKIHDHKSSEYGLIVKMINSGRDSVTGDLDSSFANSISNEILDLYNEDPIGACIPSAEGEHISMLSGLIIPGFSFNKAANLSGSLK